MRTLLVVVVIGLALVALLLFPGVFAVIRRSLERLSLRNGFKPLGKWPLDKHRQSNPDDRGMSFLGVE